LGYTFLHHPKVCKLLHHWQHRHQSQAGLTSSKYEKLYGEKKKVWKIVWWEEKSVVENKFHTVMKGVATNCLKNCMLPLPAHDIELVTKIWPNKHKLRVDGS
jgi:hypothetical protein